VKPWDELSDDARRLHARQMEVFAGMVDHTDAQIGRLMTALADLAVLDDTVVMVLSDNGASQEGMLHGATNTERFRNLMPESVEEQLPFIDELGGPTTDPHYPIGWAMAGNAPFRRCKRDTHRGGNTDPLVVHWPAGITDPGSLRTQYHHIVDMYPTFLDLAGLPVPSVVNGVEQMPIEGHSFAATIADGASPDVRTTQYYEMLGSRAIYHEGWMAVTWHKPGTDWNDDRWELYDQRTDYTQAWDLADEHPERLAALIERWWDEARRHNVLPLDDRGRDRFIDPTRPAASERRDVYRYHPGTSPIPNPSLPLILNCPHSFSVRFRLDAATDEGLLVSHGGSLAGWALYVRDRRVVYVNNNLKLSLTELSTGELPVGIDLAVRFEWEPTAPGVGDVRLLVDGHVAASLDGVRSAPRGYSMVQEGLSIGRAWGPPVDAGHYHGAFEFTGTLHVVEMRTDPSRQVQPTDRG
jgi:arylsulfatase